MTTTDPLGALVRAVSADHAAVQAALETDIALGAAVDAAREAGYSWTELAAATGLTVAKLRRSVDQRSENRRRPSATPRPQVEGMVGLAEAARIIGISTALVSRRADQGRLPYQEVGGYRRFKIADVEALAAQEGKK